MTMGFPPAGRDDAPAERDVRWWWNLAAIAALVRFALMPYGGFPTDIGTFKAWAVSLADAGPAAFYGTGFADYLPGYLYLLWVIGEINRVVRFNDLVFLFALKVPAVAADLLTAWILFTYGRRLRFPGALALSASYLFNPGVLFNSAVRGQPTVRRTFKRRLRSMWAYCRSYLQRNEPCAFYQLLQIPTKLR